MNIIKRSLILYFLIYLCTASAQTGIRFTDGSLDAIMSMAKDGGKNVFIDTYADWCKPCKRMKKKFRDRDVAKFFNEHFVNYRVDMQNPRRANGLRKKYDVVFLPTMYILDPDGNIKYYTDKELSISELLNAAQKSLDPTSYNVSNGTAIRRKDGTITGVTTPSISKPSPPKGQDKLPISLKGTATGSISKATRRAKELEKYETVDESSDKILAVLGEGELPPEILREEAYLRLEFMDGSSRTAAKKYLDTQSDWSLPVNRKFIMDFVVDANSPSYKYIVDNKDSFIKQFGADRVHRTLEVLVYRTLHDRVPRPTLEEAISLYADIDSVQSERLAHFYYINRLADEGNISALITIADSYLDQYPNDHELMYIVAGYINADKIVKKEHIDRSIYIMRQAVKLQDDSYTYYNLLSDLYSKFGDNKKALSSVNTAIEIAAKQSVSTELLEIKKQKLTSM